MTATDTIVDGQIHSAAISDEELDALSRAIRTRYSVDFSHYERRSLKRRVARIIRKFELETIHGLWVKILRDKEFFYSCIDEISVGLTEMFRNPPTWRFIRDDVLQHFPAEKKLNIWHAGTSSGEEVYTMAILLKELNRLNQTHIIGTDINQQALEKTRKGLYDASMKEAYERNYKMFEKNQEADLSKYAVYSSAGLQMQKSLILGAKIYPHNLVTDTYPQGLDIIFCRNVMIYFDQNLKGKVIENFAKALNPGGFLIIGHYDSLGAESYAYFDFYDASNKVFRKKET